MHANVLILLINCRPKVTHPQHQNKTLCRNCEKSNESTFTPFYRVLSHETPWRSLRPKDSFPNSFSSTFQAALLNINNKKTDSVCWKCLYITRTFAHILLQRQTFVYFCSPLCNKPKQSRAADCKVEEMWSWLSLLLWIHTLIILHLLDSGLDGLLEPLGCTGFYLRVLKQRAYHSFQVSVGNELSVIYILLHTKLLLCCLV